MTLESLYQRCGPQRLPEDMGRRDGLRPGNNDDDDDVDDVDVKQTSQQSSTVDVGAAAAVLVLLRTSKPTFVRRKRNLLYRTEG